MPLVEKGWQDFHKYSLSRLTLFLSALYRDRIASTRAKQPWSSNFGRFVSRQRLLDSVADTAGRQTLLLDFLVLITEIERNFIIPAS